MSGNGDPSSTNYVPRRLGMRSHANTLTVICGSRRGPQPAALPNALTMDGMRKARRLGADSVADTTRGYTRSRSHCNATSGTRSLTRRSVAPMWIAPSLHPRGSPLLRPPRCSLSLSLCHKGLGPRAGADAGGGQGAARTAAVECRCGGGGRPRWSARPPARGWCG